MTATRKKSAKKKAAASRGKKKTAAKARSAKAKASRKKAAAAKTASAKKATAKKTGAAKKAAAAKATSKKKVSKKTRRAASETAAKPRASSAADQPPDAGAESRPKEQLPTGAPTPPKKRTPRVKPTPLSDVPHPKFGLKFECFRCQARFYDLGKPDPICPKCGTDQRDRPRVVAPKQAPRGAERLIERPMVPLLDDEDEVVSEVVTFDDGEGVASSPPEVDIFDDADTASVDDDEMFDVDGRKAIRRPLVDDSDET